MLSTQPSTLSEISRRAGIAKSTASYHLFRLVAKGAVVPLGPSEQGVGTQTKRYGLREGSVVTLLSSKDEEAELARLRETFDVFTLRIRSNREEPTGEQIQGLLYGMFLHLFRISKGDHRLLMKEYGSRFWAAIADTMPKGSLRETLLRFEALRISKIGLTDLSNFGATVVISSSCIGSSFHPSNACFFFEGMIEGASKERHGPNSKVARIDIPGISSCVIAIGKGRKIDIPAVAEAVVASPSSYRAGLVPGGSKS
jgi:DNA-binding transcriptional ArsR family regulator